MCNCVIYLLYHYNGQFSNNSFNSYFHILFITLIFATQCKNTLQNILEYPPPEGTPNGGGYSFSKFFYFLFFYFQTRIFPHSLSFIYFVLDAF